MRLKNYGRNHKKRKEYSSKRAFYRALSLLISGLNLKSHGKEKLGIRAKGRKVGESRGAYHLREAQAAYNSDFTPEKDGLRAKNTYFLER